MSVYDRSSVLAKLTAFCKSIQTETEVIVIGASSILLNYNIGRSTEDVDVITKVRVTAFHRFGVDVVNEGILFLPHDYRSRLISYGMVGLVHLYALNALDLALVKLGRGSKSDIEDIKLLLSSGVLDIRLFIAKYPEFRSGYGGNYRIIDDNFSFITGYKYDSSKDRLF